MEYRKIELESIEIKNELGNEKYIYGSEIGQFEIMVVDSNEKIDYEYPEFISIAVDKNIAKI